MTAVAALALPAPAAAVGAGGNASSAALARAGAAAASDAPAAAALRVIAAPPIHTGLRELLWQRARGPCSKEHIELQVRLNTCNSIRYNVQSCRDSICYITCLRLGLLLLPLQLLFCGRSMGLQAPVFSSAVAADCAGHLLEADAEADDLVRVPAQQRQVSIVRNENARRVHIQIQRTAWVKVESATFDYSRQKLIAHRMLVPQPQPHSTSTAPKLAVAVNL